jgi:ketosteroid isomerase-like protein
MRILGILVIAGACSGERDRVGSDSGMTLAAAPATADPAAVRQSIDAANRAGLEAFNKGDIGPMLANYEEDVIVMMPGAPAMRGKSAAESELKAMLSQVDIKDMSVATEDVMLGGDYAIETGRFKWMMGPKGGKLAADSGKYLTVWHRQGDGSWKIVRDINNSDIAPKT